ncbi:MAG: divergent PAP2 family protein, partial [Lachnoanaerobaculum sp.]|nr:divergent PAP2 family protein [Lachnoanaerobaculum sp.]
MSILDDIVSNQVLISAALGWLVAQLLKTMIDIWYNKSFSPDRLWGSGGMPSSHSATVCALATSSALKHGFAGFEFAVTF